MIDFFFIHFDTSTTKDGYMTVTFDNKPGFKYIYLKSGLNFNVNDLVLVKEIDIYEEDKLLDGLSEKDKELYSKILIDSGFEYGYKIFATYDKENLLCEKTETLHEFEEQDNQDKYTFYIILRNDIQRSVSQQMVDISDITTTIGEDLRTKAIESESWRIVWNNFINLNNNTVVLQASGKELFEDNYIPAKYDDPEIIFNYIWDNEERVAHGNFRLKEGTTVALGYFGKKRKMPKFVRKLKLYKGE